MPKKKPNTFADTVSCEDCGKTVRIGEEHRNGHNQPLCAGCYGEKQEYAEVEEDRKKREAKMPPLRVTKFRCMDCDKMVEESAARWHRRMHEGVEIAAAICPSCWDKAVEGPTEPTALKETLAALEREDFHLDDLLDALAIEANDDDAYKGAHNCFKRALLDRLEDGDLAMELAFRVGEIGDPFVP
jgi:hypothetical protein